MVKQKKKQKAWKVEGGKTYYFGQKPPKFLRGRKVLWKGGDPYTGEGTVIVVRRKKKR